MSDSLGPSLDPHALEGTLSWLLDRNDALARQSHRVTPICLWGSHGIGKTTLVEELAAKKGFRYAFCSPAQFEEMGDLHGLPVQRDGRTVYATPAWVPEEPGPGILLLDDLNRADDRILRGLMPLMQNRAMMSWRLPDRWQIVATANPEGKDYSVTPLDPAMLDRMVHLHMAFEAKAWARWATRAGIDPRGISFVLLYPEIVAGERTTPRALVRFFDLIAGISDLRADVDRVWTLGRAVLEEPCIAAFVAFVHDNMALLLEPEEILESTDAAALDRRIDALARDADTLRVDRLATACTRLFLALTRSSYEPKPAHAANVIRFLVHDAMPNDLRMSLHRDLVAEGGAPIAAMLRDQTLSKKLLAGM